ncbi:MAG TPA: hypothetical protein VMB25_03990 [Bryobacteraceae bacterium]|nr:hypothetical protein [Bryobacteraceae bacterium]
MDLGLNRFLADVAAHFSAYAIALSLLGAVTMAILQTIKDLLPVRQWFQSYYLGRWMDEGAKEAQTNFSSVPDLVVSAEQAEKDLLKMAVDGDKGAFYDLQIEQLCGQYTAAIQMVLEFPTGHKSLLAITASQANSADISLVLAQPKPPTQDFLDARNRVTHQCQRAIDALQIAAGFRWKWILQLASIAVSAALAWIAMAYRPGMVAPNLISVIVSALLAGFLAPVGKDLLAIVQRARGQ